MQRDSTQRRISMNDLEPIDQSQSPSKLLETLTDRLRRQVNKGPEWDYLNYYLGALQRNAAQVVGPAGLTDYEERHLAALRAVAAGRARVAPLMTFAQDDPREYLLRAADAYAASLAFGVWEEENPEPIVVIDEGEDADNDR